MFGAIQPSTHRPSGRTVCIHAAWVPWCDVTVLITLFESPCDVTVYVLTLFESPCDVTVLITLFESPCDVTVWVLDQQQAELGV